jgi:hypothetical protein
MTKICISSSKAAFFILVIINCCSSAEPFQPGPDRAAAGGLATVWPHRKTCSDTKLYLFVFLLLQVLNLSNLGLTGLLQEDRPLVPPEN